MRFNFGKFGGFSEDSSAQTEKPDFVLVTGDAYVDHPSYGAAIIGRLLESKGYSVAVIAQPDWNGSDSFTVFGCPKYAFLVTSGNVDSMVSNYTVARKKRDKDLYSPGGAQGFRPDRAAIVYSNKIRQAYKTIPIILGGLEASLRRFSHYDYWDDKLRRSILLDSGADMLVYGMGESQITEIAASLKDSIPVSKITFVKGTAYKTKDISKLDDYLLLPSFESVKSSVKSFAESFVLQYENTDYINGKILVEDYGGIYVVQQSPAAPLEQRELDIIYSLPFTKTYHPVYESAGGIPAIQEVKFSVVSSRGCFGGCSFCALGYHQGRAVRSRSHESIIKEASKITEAEDFKGYIHDVGGPTANFRNPACKKQLKSGVCPKRQCLFPKPCERMNIDHTDYLKLLRKLRSLPKVKKVFIRSGLRYDYLIHDKNLEFFNELCKYHVSGQLKVAPEHISQKVLEKMGKPSKDVYERFVRKYYEINKKLGMKQYLVPYLMSSHPGSDLAAAIELAEYLRDMGYMPEQVQDFYPTPGTLSTCMYYTELDPRDMSPVYVPKTPHEKAQQRALIQYRLPQNYELVKSALIKSGREDLIGYGSKCLIRPRVKGYEKAQGLNQKASEKSNSSFATSKGKSGRQSNVKQKKKKTIRNVHKSHK